MTWARLDDSFYDHPKTVQAWDTNPVAVGLHARALSYIAKHEIDGKLPENVVRMWMPDQRDRARAVKTLIELDIWHENGAGYIVHDYLDYNPSRADLTARRESDRSRKAAERKG